MLKKLLTSKTKGLSLVIFSVLALAVLLLPVFAHANPLISIADYVSEGLGRLLLIIVNFLGSYVLLPLINLLVWIMSYNDFLKSTAVQVGWPLVRDISNMFFVVLLLVIAFSTILKISNYQYKNTLAKLLLMAVLVNFSKTIMGLLIDFGQVIMLTFVNAFRDAAASNLVHMFGIKDMLKIQAAGADITGFSVLGTTILAAVLLVVAIGVMLAFVAVLLMRILYLWVLVILSPLAFLLSAFPMGAKYASEFWSNFWKQLTTGIALAFFTWLALTVMSVGSSDVNQAAALLGTGSAAGTTAQQQAINGDNGTISSDIEWERLYVFIIGIALLLLALQYAGQAGGFAGGFAGKVSGKLSQIGAKAAKFATAPVWAPFAAAGFLAGKGIKTGLRTAERKFLLEPANKEGAGWLTRKRKYLTKAGWEGWGKRGEGLLQEARETAVAGAHDAANLAFGKVHTSHQLLVEERAAKKAADESGVSNLEDLKFKWKEMMNMKPGREQDLLKRGLFAYASKAAQVDDVMSIPEVMAQLSGGKDTEDYKKWEKYNNLKQVQEGIEGEEIVKQIHGEVDKDERFKTTEEKQAEVDRRIETKEYDGDKAKEATKTRMLAEHGIADAASEFTFLTRKRSGDFFKMVAQDYRGQESQAGLFLVHSHEENAFSNGHLEDIGFSRVDENTGKYRALDYTKTDEKGLTEADRMGIVEITKRDPSIISKVQAHSVGQRRLDGTVVTNNLPNGQGEYYRRILEIIDRSQEAHRINLLKRTSNNLFGGTATEDPGQKRKNIGRADDATAAIYSDSKNSLETVLSTINDVFRVNRAAYYKAGGEYVDEAGELISDFRKGVQEGFEILKFHYADKDDQGNVIKDQAGNIQYKDGQIAVGTDGHVHAVTQDAATGKYAVKGAFNKGKLEKGVPLAVNVQEYANTLGIKLKKVDTEVKAEAEVAFAAAAQAPAAGTAAPAASGGSTIGPEVKVELNAEQIVSQLAEINQRLAAAPVGSPERSQIEKEKTTFMQQQVSPKMQNNIKTVIENEQRVFGKGMESWIKNPEDRVLFIQLLKKQLDSAFRRNPDMSKLMEEEILKDFTLLRDDFSNINKNTIGDEETMRRFYNKFKP
ncbi:MAG: hypothetical protein NTZ18_02565 [Candidatus Komeilibacteria bacterium]|nr:hypothetical protein [Candidatus Komeilibacteria bacterium]